jgi:hypothetical protein
MFGFSSQICYLGSSALSRRQAIYIAEHCTRKLFYISVFDDGDFCKEIFGNISAKNLPKTASGVKFYQITIELASAFGIKSIRSIESAH